MTTTQDTSTNPTEWVVSAPGARRRILTHAPELMMVEFAFETGAEGAPHSHPHVQTTHVASGVFDFVVGGVKHRLTPGQSLSIPSNVVHSCVAIEAGTLLDAFTPRRDDFL